jgi:hypothetical protein
MLVHGVKQGKATPPTATATPATATVYMHQQQQA